VAEVLHLAVLVSVTSLTVNYWRPAAQQVQSWLAFDPTLVGVVVFWVLFVSGYLLLRALVRRGAALLGWERLNPLIQLVSVSLGAARGLCWIGLLLVALGGSGVPYLQSSAAERSVLGIRLMEPAQELLARVTGWFPGSGHRGEPLLPPLRAAKPASRAAGSG
jgi:hypothetical protein